MPQTETESHTNESSSSPSPEEHKSSQSPDNDAFRLNRAWLLLGLAAIFVGILSGFIMSSATFLR